jgi:hypothetical protein
MPPLSCSVSILVARTDIAFMMHTIPHLLRMCNFPFSERVLCVDTAPLSGDKVNRPGVGTLDQLRDCCGELLSRGIVDHVVDIDYAESYRDRAFQKHFQQKIRHTHNYKGYPILGSIFAIERATSDYLLRFDSDMLLHQSPNYNWVEAGMQLMEDVPEIVAIRPLTGPPSQEVKLHSYLPYHHDSRGFYSFKFFSSRAYLINRKRFDQLLPLAPLWRPYRHQLLNSLPNKLKTVLNYRTVKGFLDSWEVMVSQRLEETQYVRAVLDSPNAWTLHPIDRSPQFIQALPAIIQKIETGWYPPDQAGLYDLQSRCWLEALNCGVHKNLCSADC